MLVRIRGTILIFYLLHVSVHHAAGSAEIINELCKRYSRDVTVLEIGSHAGAYLFWLAKQYKGTYILMDQHFPFHGEMLENVSYKNIVLLHPRIIDSSLLYNLGKCEHFDIVIIRDLEQWASSTLGALQSALTLGDHLFIELSEDLVETAQALHACEITTIEPGKAVCYFEINKQYITKPRWTSTEESLTNYGIVSNFAEKRMDKQSTNTSSKWIPGVNLLTFLILKGVYPTDKMMRKQLKTFKRINHNDLVLGNIVVQGRNITPIDFHDRRRNVDPAICVKAALKKVIRDGRLKKDPEAMLRNYSEYLQHHKRRMRS